MAAWVTAIGVVVGSISPKLCIRSTLRTREAKNAEHVLA